MPENVWKAFIDMEISLELYDRVRELYKRLMQRTKHVKVWLSYAKFETENARDADLARAVYQEGSAHFKQNEPELKEERLLILENWLKLEQSPLGSLAHQAIVEAKLPKRVKKRRRTTLVDQ
jgi:crooked neck